MSKSFVNVLIKEKIEQLSENYINVFGEEYFIKNLQEFLIEETNTFFLTEIMQERGITIIGGDNNEPKVSFWKDENPELFMIKEMIKETNKTVKLMILKTEHLDFIKELIKLTIRNPNFLLISLEEAQKDNNFINSFSETIFLNKDSNEIEKKLMKNLENSFEIKIREVENLNFHNPIKQRFNSTKEKIENMRRFRK